MPPAKGTLYLIPNALGGRETLHTIPHYILNILKQMTHFIVESEKTARRFMRGLDKTFDLDSIKLYPLNKRTDENDVMDYLQLLLSGEDVGLLSEAGMPGVADPGAALVQMAHQNGIKVVPLSGPSSILLALAASGMNGQNFTFHGYLPIKQQERVRKIQELERLSATLDQTQIFIETPFRNMQLLKDIVAKCRPQTELCIAANITLPNELIRTKNIASWQKSLPDLHKKPAVFLLYARR